MEVSSKKSEEERQQKDHDVYRDQFIAIRSKLSSSQDNDIS